MTKYTPGQLINSIESLVNSEAIDHHLLLAEIHTAIQQQITRTLGVNVFGPQTAETKAIRNTIAQDLLGADKEETNDLNTGTETQAALRRVEELKIRYTPEQIVEMRKLRAEVKEMVSSVSKNDAETVLEKYGISIYRGYKVDGSASEFLKNSTAYKRWIEAGVIFKSDLRKESWTKNWLLGSVMRCTMG